jgi:hypothetical protein
MHFYGATIEFDLSVGQDLSVDKRTLGQGASKRKLIDCTLIIMR